jgi:hypothetical protein
MGWCIRPAGFAWMENPWLSARSRKARAQKVFLAALSRLALQGYVDDEHFPVCDDHGRVPSCRLSGRSRQSDRTLSYIVKWALPKFRFGEGGICENSPPGFDSLRCRGRQRC